MFCSKCGKQLNDGAAFCDSCGTESEGSLLGQGSADVQRAVSNENTAAEPSQKAKSFVVTIVSCSLWNLCCCLLP